MAPHASAPWICRTLEGIRGHLRLAVDRSRGWRLRLRGAHVGRKVGVGPRVRVDRPWCVALGRRVRIEQDVHLKIVADGARLSVGSGSYLGPSTHVDVQEEVVIEDGVLIGPWRVIVDHDHGMDPARAVGEQPCHAQRITIGAGAWLGAHVVVLRGVQVGPGAVIGAGAVVHRDVPPGAIAVGVPARIVGMRGAAAAASAEDASL